MTDAEGSSRSLPGSAAGQSLLESFTTDFKYPQYGIVRSRWLKIPQLLVTAFIVGFVLMYQVIYKLRFLEEVPVQMAFSPTFWPTQPNWWNCSTYAGNCEYDAPRTDEFCGKPQPFELFNITQSQNGISNISPECEALDLERNIYYKAQEVLVDTRITAVKEMRKNLTSPWTLVNDAASFNHSLILGPDQWLAFEGQTGPHTTINYSFSGLQGFIQFENESEPRRIRCAKQGYFLPYCDNVPEGQFWSERVRNVSGGEFPDFSIASSGCLITIGYVYCRVSELLAAAGVDLDEIINGTTGRVMGTTLKVTLVLSNAVTNDFWQWRFGFKPKYVIKVARVGAGHNPGPCRITYQHSPGSGTERSSLHHFCLSLVFEGHANWYNFSVVNVVLIFVVIGSMFTYGPEAVAMVLVKIYRCIPRMAHVSALFQHHTYSYSCRESEMEGWEQMTHSRFQELQRDAQKEHFTGRWSP